MREADSDLENLNDLLGQKARPRPGQNLVASWTEGSVASWTEGSAASWTPLIMGDTVVESLSDISWWHPVGIEKDAWKSPPALKQTKEGAPAG